MGDESNRPHLPALIKVVLRSACPPSGSESRQNIGPNCFPGSWSQLRLSTSVENFERDGNTRPPDLPLEKSVCRLGSNRTGHGTTDWFQIGKGVFQGCILSPCLFNLYAEYIMRNTGLEETQAGIKIARRNINNLAMQMTPPLWQKVKRN